MSVLYIRDESGAFKAITTIAGEAGVGIADVIIEEIIRLSPGVGGHKITVVLTDGRQYSFEVDDGKNGSTGPRGDGITEIKLAEAGVDQYGRHYQIIEIWWRFTSDAGVQPMVTRYTVYDGKDGEDAKVVQEVEENGTDAVSGAAVAAYVDIRVAQLGLYVLITGQPVPITVNAGEVATFDVGAVGKGLMYQWQHSTDGGNSWSDSGEEGNNTARLQFIANDHNGYMYRCVITDANGNKAITEPVMLTVIANIVITKQPQSVTALAGDTVTFTVVATGTGLTYQWEYRQGESSTKWSNSTSTGTTTNELTLVAKGYQNGYQYRCLITDQNGNTVYTEVVSLTIG